MGEALRVDAGFEASEGLEAEARVERDSRNASRAGTRREDDAWRFTGSTARTRRAR